MSNIDKQDVQVYAKMGCNRGGHCCPSLFSNNPCSTDYLDQGCSTFWLTNHTLESKQGCGPQWPECPPLGL